MLSLRLLASVFVFLFVLAFAPCQAQQVKHQSLINADLNPIHIYVGSDSPDFQTLTDAIESIPINNTNRYILRLQPGIYREKVVVPKHVDFVTITGSSQKIYDTKIIYNDTHASANGTSKSATLNVLGKYFDIEYVTIENDAPFANPGDKDGQAVALKFSGDFGRVSNCLITSSQDTLLDDQGRHYFENTTIQGNIDFIFGSGRSLYENCKLLSNSNSTNSPGKVTAQGRSNTTEHTSGFSFHNCYVGGTGKLLLGRPWGSRAFVVFIESYLDDIIEPAGWMHWNDIYDQSNSTVLYGEYNNFGPGANSPRRVNWTRTLASAEADLYGSTDFVYGGEWL